ncbi:hypothetical protein A33M_4055 [Rhodovulum sp. PH10]|nr:hypothetical protein A33M_4055 [Rhodovulum sp. PH10]
MTRTRGRQPSTHASCPASSRASIERRRWIAGSSPVMTTGRGGRAGTNVR